MKFNSKVPGLSSDIVQAELDLTYKVECFFFFLFVFF